MKRRIVFIALVFAFTSFGFSSYGSISFYFGNHWIADKNIQDVYGINFARYGGEVYVNGFMGLGGFVEYNYMRQFGKTSYFKEETQITLKPLIVGIMINRGIFIKVGKAFVSFKETSPIGDFEDDVSGWYYSLGYMGRIISILHFRVSVNYMSADYHHVYEDGEEIVIQLGGFSTDVGIGLRF